MKLLIFITLFLLHQVSGIPLANVDINEDLVMTVDGLIKELSNDDDSFYPSYDVDSVNRGIKHLQQIANEVSQKESITKDETNMKKSSYQSHNDFNSLLSPKRQLIVYHGKRVVSPNGLNNSPDEDMERKKNRILMLVQDILRLKDSLNENNAGQLPQENYIQTNDRVEIIPATHVDTAMEDETGLTDRLITKLKDVINKKNFNFDYNNGGKTNFVKRTQTPTKVI